MTGTAVLPGGEVVQILGVDWGGDAVVRDVRLVAPRRTRGRGLLALAGSVLVSVPSPRATGSSPGAKLALMAGGVPRTVRVGGILELSGVARASGGDILLTDIFTAQDLLGRPRLVDRVDVVLDPGAPREAMRGRRSLRRLPPGLTLEPPGRAAATADRMVRAFRFNLNALGSLTLLVGMFLIANAVSIAVLRRRPEIATLRALGTSRASIFAAFLVEGVVVGVAGTLLGESSASSSRARPCGRSPARCRALRADGPHLAADWSGPAALAALVGLAASLVATLLPAFEAMRVAPAPAMRAGAIERVVAAACRCARPWRPSLWRSPRRRRFAAPVDGLPLFGFAAVGLVVAALALMSPLLVRAGAALPHGLPPRTLGPAGRLGAGFFGGALAKNGIAVTALAMALGMTLAMIVTVASIRETVRVWVETTLRSDLWIKADAGGRTGIVGDLPQDVLAFLRVDRGRRRGRPVPRTRGVGRARASVHPGVGRLSRRGPLRRARASRRAGPARGGARGPRARRGPGLRALRPALRRRRRGPACASRRPRGRGRFASPACTGTTPTTAARS